MKRLYKINWLVVLLIFAFFIRLFRLSVPPRYIFDEVYHVVTVKAIAVNNPAGYEWWHEPPEPNTAYDWLHPPLAKLIQASSVKLLSTSNSFAWRFPSALFGTLSIAALYYLALTVTKKKQLALLAAALFSFDGLQLTMSRITMNDIFLTTWILLALTYFYKALHPPQKSLKKHLLLTGLFTGLALATKHSAVLLYPVFTIFLLPRLIKTPQKIFFFFYSLFLLPLTIYFFSYSQFFLQGHTLKQFYQLHQQIYWYQTGLTATHSYQSSAWQWPLLIRPVWFHVDYQPNTIANIYNLGNPFIFWGGLAAVISAIIYFQKAYLFPLVAYFSLFAPFVFSPRIMFLHHYLPALPILCLILSLILAKLNRLKLTLIFLLLVFTAFLFFYPLNTAFSIPKDLLKYFFWLPTWR